MQPQNPDYAQKIREIFTSAAFIADVGILLEEVQPGMCISRLIIQPKHLQQDTFVHAGVQATIADHTAGGAAGTLIRAEEIVLTVEFKINLLRPAVGEQLRCKAKVLRAGKTLIVAESEVYAVANSEEKLCAKAMVTLAVVTP